MFKIEDGRNSFFQWDVNRRLIIEDGSITEVHFCNRTDSCSLVCETYQENGLTLVNVPNVLLQNDWRINVYAFDSEYTKHCEVFKVNTRTKPTDYVYTETEIKRYEDLEERIAALENAPGGGGSGGNVDLSDYYTKEEVDSKISHVYKYCGSVNNLNELSNISTKAIGDTYNVINGGNKTVNIYPDWEYITTEVNGVAYLRIVENGIDITNSIPKGLRLFPWAMSLTNLTEYGWELEYGIPPYWEGTYYGFDISCKDGDNVAWTGFEWDVLSGIVDLNNYYTKTQTDKKINDLSSSVDERFINTNAKLDGIDVSGKQDKSNMINGSIYIGMSPDDWEGSYPSTPTMMRYVQQYTEEKLSGIEEATAAIIALQNSYIGGETV